MAPKRKGKKVIGTVVRSTRKVVKETVEVKVVTAATDSQLTQESTQEAEDQNLPETETQDDVADVPVRTIPVGEKVYEKVEEREQVVDEGPLKELLNKAVDGAPGGREEDAAGKEEQTKEVQITTEEGEPSKDEEEKREEQQTSGLSQEETLPEEQPQKDTSTARAVDLDQEQTSKKEGAEAKRGGGKERLSGRNKRRTTPEEGKKGGGETSIGRKKRKRGTVDSAGHGYKRYVFRVMKQVHPEMRVSSMAMDIINSLMNDMFERIADEAAKLLRYHERATLSSGEIQGAVKLVLPGELGKHAIAEGAKAVANYISYDKKKKTKTS
ncbi:hypothetical protein Tsubulata_010854 [Turnera subulata]|uniref:Core Histone H2A/H2B/H3 domain-containing protein n=1 Tax=Turnera subulata TaxID=218843 RepID=A0A9Q0FS52_9ROSI|nr:hypothetical protein Tsubulata_010854 [Turnera subulata]